MIGFLDVNKTIVIVISFVIVIIVFLAIYEYSRRRFG